MTTSNVVHAVTASLFTEMRHNEDAATTLTDSESEGERKRGDVSLSERSCCYYIYGRHFRASTMQRPSHARRNLQQRRDAIGIIQMIYWLGFKCCSRRMAYQNHPWRSREEEFSWEHCHRSHPAQPAHPCPLHQACNSSSSENHLLTAGKETRTHLQLKAYLSSSPWHAGLELWQESFVGGRWPTQLQASDLYPSHLQWLQQSKQATEKMII